MAVNLSFLFATSLFLHPLLAAPVSSSTFSNTDTSLTILYQNNLNASDDVNHISAILLDAVPVYEAQSECARLNEQLLSRQAIEAHSSDFYYQLSYLAYDGRASPNQQYIIADGVVSLNRWGQSLDFDEHEWGWARLPVLCTQSSNASQPATSVATSSNQITINAGPNNYIGFRNLKSWRFSGIRFANTPQRFKYTSIYSGTGQTLDATKYGSECVQSGAGPGTNGMGSEDCLFLNIQTPYIPKAGETQGLKPVYFFIHGGGFNNGVGSDPGFDGGNLASREDVVVVTINYRLGTLGFFSVPGTNITGNYGIADQIIALNWVKKYISYFGGNPNQITILGSSAGAGSVRVLLGSPPAIGLFQGGVAESNLGGGVDLGLPNNYATSYSSYLTIPQAYAVAGEQIFQEVGCNQSSIADQIACLTVANASLIGEIATIADKVVQDGYYVNTEQLIVSVKNGSTAHVPVIFGTAENDGAAFCSYPHQNVTSESQGIQLSLGISAEYAEAIINSGLFPFYSTGNLTLDSFNVSQRVATDNQFRCIDQATVYAGSQTGAFERAYFYTSTRTEYGYDPNNLGASGLSAGPVAPGYPNGDPYLPYFRLHGSDQPWSFGNPIVIRDPADLYSLQLETSYYATFVKTGDPNPNLQYLQARGYDTVIQGVQRSGPWEPVQGLQGPTKLLDWPSVTTGFLEVEQCAWLNYSVTYYLDSNRG